MRDLTKQCICKLADGSLQFRNAPPELLDFRDPDKQLRKNRTHLRIAPRHLGAEPWDTPDDLWDKLRLYIQATTHDRRNLK